MLFTPFARASSSSTLYTKGQLIYRCTFKGAVPTSISRSLAAYHKMAAKSISSEEYNVVGDVKIIERFWEVPLDHDNENSSKIRLFGRIAIPAAKENDNLKTMVYLQGGPGFECSFPKSHPLTQVAFDKGYQILYLDQRGTGLSTPVSSSTVFAKGGSTPEAQANWLRLFLADSIVRDCEAVRKNLLGDKEKEEDRKWTLLGQSYGGFVAIHYLCAHPEGLREVFTAGGMPPLVDAPDAIYEALYGKVKERNKVYYEKYPNDIKRVRDILKHLESHPVMVPNGGRLTPRRFLQLGLSLGFHGGIDTIHQIVLRATSDLESTSSLSQKLLQTISSQQPFDTNILYIMIHELIYCQSTIPPRWSASRILNSESNSIFVWEKMSPLGDTQPVYFTGEMIYPWMFDEYSELADLFPVADVLANKSDWKRLYDVEKLKENKVPVNAAIFVDDMYVDFKLALETATTIGNCKFFITNAMFHDAIRSKCGEVMGQLFGLSKRVVD